MQKHRRFYKKLVAVTLAVTLTVTGINTGTMVKQASAENVAQTTDKKNGTASGAEVVIELTDERTENSNTYLMSDGSKQLEMYGENIRYKEKGKWINYDSSLKDLSNTEERELKKSVSDSKTPSDITADEYKYINKKGDSRQYFAEKVDEDTPIVMKRGGDIISFYPVIDRKNSDEKQKETNNDTMSGRPVDASSETDVTSEAELTKENVKNNVITYEEKTSDIRYTYESLNNGTKENIILSGKPETNIFKYQYNTGGLLAVQGDSSTIYLVDEKKELVAEITAPCVIDGDGNTTEDAVSLLFNENEDKTYTIEAEVDEEYLKSAKYPVTVDPTVRWNTAGIVTRQYNPKESNPAYPGSYQFEAGWDEDGYEKLSLLPVHTAVNKVKNAIILNCTLELNICSVIGTPKLYIKNIAEGWGWLDLYRGGDAPALGSDTYGVYSLEGYQPGDTLSVSLMEYAKRCQNTDYESYGIALKVLDKKADNLVAFNGESAYYATEHSKLVLNYYDIINSDAVYDGSFEISGEYEEEGNIRLEWGKENTVSVYGIYERKDEGEFQYLGETGETSYSVPISEISTADFRVIELTDTAKKYSLRKSNILTFKKNTETTTSEDGNEETAVSYDLTTMDTDGDGLEDGYEIWDFKTLWNTETADSTKENPVYDLDSDNDGLPDSYEVFTLGTDPAVANPKDENGEDMDSDGDGLTDLEEYQKGTDPWLKDSDFDGTNDRGDFTPRKTNKYTRATVAAAAQVHKGLYDREYSETNDGVTSIYITSIYRGEVKSLYMDYGNFKLNKKVKYFYDAEGRNTAIIEEYDEEYDPKHVQTICITYTYDNKGNLVFICDQSTKYTMNYDSEGNMQNLLVGNQQLVNYTNMGLSNNVEEENVDIGEIISSNQGITNYKNGQKVKKIDTIYKVDDGDTKSVAEKIEIYYDDDTVASYVTENNSDGNIIRLIDYTEDMMDPIIYTYIYDGDSTKIVRSDNFTKEIINEKDSETNITKTSTKYSFKNIKGDKTEYTLTEQSEISDEEDTIDTVTLYNQDKFSNILSENGKTATNKLYSSLYKRNILTSTKNEISSTHVYLDLDTYTEDKNIEYIYDKVGNIINVKINEESVYEYSYDAHGRLVSQKDCIANECHEYEYDTTGNIHADCVYPLDENGNKIQSEKQVKYSEYENEQWPDQLTMYDEQKITYDEFGNPLKYIDGMTFNWERGRQLKGIAFKDNSKAVYKYNSNGLRIYKDTVDKTTKYEWDETNLIRETVTYKESNKTFDIWYFYDANGDVIGYEYSQINDISNKLNTTRVYYEKNLQGDVIGLLDSRGVEIATYAYDAWGNIKTTICYEGNETAYNLNHIAYRSYYRDEESGFYYLQTRYYDANICRFISADSYSNTGRTGTLLTYNLYTYCESNPVINTDKTGTRIVTVVKNLAFYNTTKKIFYYSINAVQRTLGYCSAFDYGSGAVGFDIGWLDVRFKYGDKEWRIELWKGIYGKLYGFDMSSGAEIGVYYRKNNYFPGWYQCADNENCLTMSYYLYAGKTELYRRSSYETDNYKGKHWWLTGFKPGVRKKPNELSMKHVLITFKNEDMAKAFEKAIKKVSGSKNTGKAKNVQRGKSTVKFEW